MGFGKEVGLPAEGRRRMSACDARKAPPCFGVRSVLALGRGQAGAQPHKKGRGQDAQPPKKGRGQDVVSEQASRGGPAGAARVR